jgi:hypothetical protein
MIYVFKTSVRTKIQAKKLKQHIDKLLPNNKWSFDLENCDTILRIDGGENVVPKIKRLLDKHSFACEELD